jgi:hypothetical protein
MTQHKLQPDPQTKQTLRDQTLQLADDVYATAVDEEQCDRIAALMMCTADAPARREWLWLRAMEKRDHDSARDLERVDPALLDRMERAYGDLAEQQDYGRLLEECMWRNAFRILRRERSGLEAPFEDTSLDELDNSVQSSAQCGCPVCEAFGIDLSKLPSD